MNRGTKRMLTRRLLFPLIAAVLVALGGGLEKLGIDLTGLGGDGSDVSSQKSPQVFNTPASNPQVSSSTTQYQSGRKWSNTSPEINLHHVFEGEINRKGRPTGYHSRPGGVDADGAKIIRITDGPNSLGIYTAVIAIRDGNQWKEKQLSSFFPDSMSPDEVIAAIVNAYKNSANQNSQPWRGPSGLGFDIQGYTTSRGGINTAFPLYRGN